MIYTVRKLCKVGKTVSNYVAFTEGEMQKISIRHLRTISELTAKIQSLWLSSVTTKWKILQEIFSTEKNCQTVYSKFNGNVYEF